MILIADEFLENVDKLVADLRGQLSSLGVTVNVERGKAWKNSNGDGIEHFGYVDGRSQPLVLVSDIKKEQTETDGTSVWSPEFPLSQALVKDPAGTGKSSFGSYFVFRKLEQNVRKFKEMEELCP
jgi:deferrochelatase/peroxidase EfeB